MSFCVGQVIGPFEIIGRLGAGAMGEVHRARDRSLDREVAIKALSGDRAGDHDMIDRLEREAKALASLNHPNIAQIYGVHRVDSTQFIVLELVEGDDLSSRLARGALPWREAVAICRQVADGLEAAHERGVIHRDLKPANIRITPDGVAKVLDFGLARIEPTLPSLGGTTVHVSPTATVDGVLLGTPAYMSPEQVRGQPVDRRTDIWAFGCLLHECLTGERPFAGETLTDLSVAIVDREPERGSFPPNTPPALRGLIDRCLVKDARRRLRDIGEARNVLEGDLVEGDPAEEPSRATGAAPILVTALLAATATWAISRGARPEPPIDIFRNARFQRITDTEATEFDASLSRDGTWLAYISDRDGVSDLWAGPTGSENHINLTKGRHGIWSLKVRDHGFDLAGTSILITPGDSDDERMRSIPITGGELGAIYAPRIVNIDWTSDGHRAAYHTLDDGDPVYVAEPDLSDPVQLLVLEPGLHQHYPTWSSDDEWIYLVRGRPATREMDLWRVRPTPGGEAEQLTYGLLDVAYPTPLDADTVLFIAHEPSGAGPWLYSLDLRTKHHGRVTVGAEQYTSIATSEDGRKLIATIANPRARLYRVPILPDRIAKESDVRPVEGLESTRALAPRFGGDDLYFLSSRGTGDGIWRFRDGKVEEIVQGSHARLMAAPAVHPDGSFLACVMYRKGRYRLCLIDANGGSPRTLSDQVDVFGAPAWSPDGRWIAIGGKEGKTEGLYIFSTDPGVAPRRIYEGEANSPAWSPTDDLIVFAGIQVSAFHRLEAVRPSNGERFALPEIRITRLGERFRFLPDGSGLVYMLGLPIAQGFFLLDLETLESRQLTEVDPTARMSTFDIDPTGTGIVFDRLRQNSDVYLIELDGDGSMPPAEQ